MPNHYTYRAEWSPEDGEFVGLVAEFPSLSWLAASASEAVAGAEQLVDDILSDMEQSGEAPPVPLTERRYSGNISLRTSPAQHRALTIEAAEQGVSVNSWINHKIDGPYAGRRETVVAHGPEGSGVYAAMTAAQAAHIRGSEGYQSAVHAAIEAQEGSLQHQVQVAVAAAALAMTSLNESDGAISRAIEAVRGVKK